MGLTGRATELFDDHTHGCLWGLKKVEALQSTGSAETKTEDCSFGKMTEIRKRVIVEC